MSAFNGTDLLQVFNDLQINTGNVSKLTIDSWFDTDCNATKQMLNWMCSYLSEDNILTLDEKEEYEECHKNKLLIDDKHYDGALEEIKSDFPGILEYEDNLFDVECMEDELELLLKQERDLEQTLRVNGNLSKLLSKKINRATEEDIQCTVEKAKVENNCKELSLRLDDVHQKLFTQIERYAKHLEGFENATGSGFLSSISTNNYEQYITDVTSYLNLVLNKKETLVLNSTVRSVRKNLEVSFSGSTNSCDQLEVLWKRLFKSQKNLFRKQLKQEKLKTEIEFFKNLNVTDILAFLDDVNAQCRIEASNLSKERQLEHLVCVVENNLKQKTDLLLDERKIFVLQNDINNKIAHLELLKEQNSKVTRILALQKVLGLLFEQEHLDIKITDEFFRRVYDYISGNLSDSVSRRDLMSQIIDSQRIHKDLPLEKRYKLLTLMRSFFTEQKSDQHLIDMHNSFQKSFNKVEIQAFVSDYAEHRQFTKQLTSQISIMRNFLTTGATSQIMIFPYKAASDLDESVKLLEKYENLLKSMIQTKYNAGQQLRNEKWFKLKRQLWIFFLTEPKKIIQVVKQIEMELKEVRKAAE